MKNSFVYCSLSRTTTTDNRRRKIPKSSSSSFFFVTKLRFSILSKTEKKITKEHTGVRAKKSILSNSSGDQTTTLICSLSLSLVLLLLLWETRSRFAMSVLRLWGGGGVHVEFVVVVVVERGVSSFSSSSFSSSSFFKTFVAPQTRRLRRRCPPFIRSIL